MLVGADGKPLDGRTVAANYGDLFAATVQKEGKEIKQKGHAGRKAGACNLGHAGCA